MFEAIKSDKTQTKSNYCLRIELKDKTHLLGMDHALAVNNWCRIIRRGKKTFDEVMRTDDKKLRKNIDKLIWYFRNKKANEVIKYCIEEFEIFSMCIRIDKTKPEMFIKTMTNAQLNSFDVIYI